MERYDVECLVALAVGGLEERLRLLAVKGLDLLAAAAATRALAATLRGTRSSLTACESALCSVTWM